LAVPRTASASTLVVSSIGTFSWSEGFFGADLSLTNDSNLAGLPADFTAVVLTLVGDQDGDGVTDSATLNAFDSILGYVAGANSWFESWSVLDSAFLTFNFNPLLPTGSIPLAGQSQSSILLDGPNEIFLQYSYLAPDSPPDPAPVPEPATLVLLTAGIGAGATWRRRLSAGSRNRR
jgi:hypothetical protein